MPLRKGASRSAPAEEAQVRATPRPVRPANAPPSRDGPDGVRIPALPTAALLAAPTAPPPAPQPPTARAGSDARAAAITAAARWAALGSNAEVTGTAAAAPAAVQGVRGRGTPSAAAPAQAARAPGCQVPLAGDSGLPSWLDTNPAAASQMRLNPHAEPWTEGSAAVQQLPAPGDSAAAEPAGEPGVADKSPPQQAQPALGMRGMAVHGRPGGRAGTPLFSAASAGGAAPPLRGTQRERSAQPVPQCGAEAGGRASQCVPSAGGEAFLGRRQAHVTQNVRVMQEAAARVALPAPSGQLPLPAAAQARSVVDGHGGATWALYTPSSGADPSFVSALVAARAKRARAREVPAAVGGGAAMHPFSMRGRAAPDAVPPCH